MKICAFCGKSFPFKGIPTKHTPGKFCSRSCAGKVRTGKYNPNWKGGRVHLHGRSLLYAPNHPGAVHYNGVHVFEHRLVAETVLGRHLKDGEIVHHLNGDLADNRPENLQVMTQSEHARLHGNFKNIPLNSKDPKTGRFISREQASQLNGGGPTGPGDSHV